MIMRHHVDPDELMSYAAGTCPEWQALVVACHLTYCTECRDELALLDDLGGALLESVTPVAPDRLTSTSITSSSAPQHTAEPEPAPPRLVDPALPAPLSAFVAEPAPRWRFLAPGVRHIPLSLSVNGNPVRVVKFRPGYTIPEHSHSGPETLVIFSGSLDDSRTGERYGRGDVCRSETGSEHRQDIGNEGPCIALVVNVGELVPKSFMGRVLKKIAGV